jgi:branched-chain amino acid transport system ATP-binding protein
MSALAVRDLHAYYGESHALQGVSLDVPEGGAVSLVGRNGAGKTTTIAAIVGFIRPRGGAVSVRGTDITGRPPHEIARRGVALVPQGRRVFRDLTVRENLTLSIDRGGAWDLARVLDLFPSLAGRLENFGDQLSGGEQQMVAIGRALMARPKLMLLDEPSMGLAPMLVAEIYEIVARLNRDEKVAVLLAEQNATMALRAAQYAYVMESGRIVLDGDRKTISENEDIKEFYLGLSGVGQRKSYRDVKHYKRRKRWLS